MRNWARLCTLLMLGTAGTASAQLGLPNISKQIGGGVLGRIDETVVNTTKLPTELVRDVGQLASDRVERLDAFVHANRAGVEFDDTHQPARAHELLLLDPDAAALTRAAASGYMLIEEADIEGLGVHYARLTTPPDTPLAPAIRQLRRLLPEHEISADQLHFASGGAVPTSGNEGTAGPPHPTGGTVGIIDGGTQSGARIADEAGFARGAPHANPHAQAIASLLAGAGTARIYVADVYGTDPAGGDAVAIARALGWMAGKGVPVVSISLVGPSNPLLERAIAAIQAKNIIVTAAVGNDGAAAPPAFPASYPGVVAVTGVDARGRVLFEAGRASHLDYAAPGADVTAIGLDGKAHGLRGTSFAAPLVASRLAAFGPAGEAAVARLARADAEAVKRSAKTGHGVLCGACRKGI